MFLHSNNFATKTGRILQINFTDTSAILLFDEKLKNPKKTMTYNM